MTHCTILKALDMGGTHSTALKALDIGETIGGTHSTVLKALRNLRLGLLAEVGSLTLADAPISEHGY